MRLKHKAPNFERPDQKPYDIPESRLNLKNIAVNNKKFFPTERTPELKSIRFMNAFWPHQPMMIHGEDQLPGLGPQLWAQGPFGVPALGHVRVYVFAGFRINGLGFRV